MHGQVSARRDYLSERCEGGDLAESSVRRRDEMRRGEREREKELLEMMHSMVDMDCPIKLALVHLP